MLVTRRRCNKRLTSLRLMDALDQSLFFQRFERTVNGDQAKRGMGVPSFIVNLDWGEGMRTMRHNLHNGATRLGEAIALFIQLDKPRMFTHTYLFLKLKI